MYTQNRRHTHTHSMSQRPPLLPMHSPSPTRPLLPSLVRLARGVSVPFPVVWHVPGSIARKKLVVVLSIEGCLPAWNGPYDPYDVPDSLIFTITPVDGPHVVSVSYLLGKDVRFGIGIFDANNSSFAQESDPEDVFRRAELSVFSNPVPFEILDESLAQTGFLVETTGFPWQLRVDDVTGGVRTSDTRNRLFVELSLAYTGAQERPEPMWAHMLKELSAKLRNP